MVFGGHDPSLLNIYYHHADHLGSSSYITNGAGVVCQHMEYLPFGETLIDEHLNSNNSPFKFNGKEFDEETGNYYYGARYYDPKLSIFISVDPLAEKTMDAYGYCFQNPVNLVDPTGTEALPPDDYVFDEHGKYVRTDKTDTEDMLVIENSKTKEKTYYTFNDPKTDVASIEYNIKIWGDEFKKIQFVYGITESWMDFFAKEGDIYERGYLSRMYFAATESSGGKLDASVYHLPSLIYATDNHRHITVYDVMDERGPMYIFQNDGYRAYNHLDAGNFIWGNFMVALGFNTAEAIDAAKSYNKNDSKADINAIMRGATLQRNDIYGELPVTNTIINAVEK